MESELCLFLLCTATTHPKKSELAIMQFHRMRPWLLALLLPMSGIGQEAPALNPLIEAYIDMYRDVAVREMQRTGVPVSIKLAQGILETSAGSSTLVRTSNNHFGIKCKSSWTGARVFYDDDEQGECFRKYESPEDSYRDHSDFLRNQIRYAALFTLPPTDYQGWAYGLKQAGYATNPRYPELLIQYIETYRLDVITQDVLAGRFGTGPEPRPDTASTLTGAAAPRASGPSANGMEPGKPAPMTASNAEAEPAAGGGIRLFREKSVLVHKGTSLLVVADHYQVPLAKLLEWNDLDASQDILSKDRMIRIRRLASLSTQSKSR